jgi:hypothetical protein
LISITFKIFKLIYAAVTCHWIDASWELQDALLEFKHVPGHHTGNALANEVYDILEEYELFEKLFCITMDNASNNEKMMKCLSRRLKDEQNIDWDPSEHHVACLNHVINLAVDDFMKAIKGYTEETEEHSSDNDDDDDDTDDNSIPIEMRVEGVMSTVFKIKTIGKVRQSNEIESVAMRSHTMPQFYYILLNLLRVENYIIRPSQREV